MRSCFLGVLAVYGLVHVGAKKDFSVCVWVWVWPRGGGDYVLERRLPRRSRCFLRDISICRIFSGG
jgi:hypothetical protein